MKKYVIVKLQFEGIHHWESCNIDEVSFLKNNHRHIFHIKASRQVSSNDREIEILQLKKAISTYIKTSYPEDIGCMSCEDIAEDLINTFDLSSCEVLEDGENGALFIKEQHES